MPPARRVPERRERRRHAGSMRTAVLAPPGRAATRGRRAAMRSATWSSGRQTGPAAWSTHGLVRLAVAAGLLLAVAALLASLLGAAAGVLSTLALGCCAIGWDAARRLERARTACWPPEDDSTLMALGPSPLANDDSLWARLADAVGVPSREAAGLAIAARAARRGGATEGPRVLH